MSRSSWRDIPGNSQQLERPELNSFPGTEAETSWMAGTGCPTAVGQGRGGEKARDRAGFYGEGGWTGVERKDGGSSLRGF